MESQQAQRKNEHLSLATKYYQQAHVNHPFDQVRLIHTALPEKAVSDIHLTTALAPGLKLTTPFYIEAMTGGSNQAKEINRQLAYLAAKHHLAMATGSVSLALKNPQYRSSFKVVREENPDGLVIANLSAKATISEAQDAVDLLEANAIEIHLNAAQELIMPEGDRAFYWLTNIRNLVNTLNIPVIVKEVGFGMNKEDVARLSKIGVKIINVSGRGGTNFAMIENRRNHQTNFNSMIDWGQTTPEALLEAQAAGKDTIIIASGGITSPLDVIKSGVLGAQACGVAGYFLNVLAQGGVNALDHTINEWKVVTTRLLTLLGVNNYAALRKANYVLGPQLLSYANQRHLKA